MVAIKQKSGIETKHIVTSVIGGALLYYAYRNKDTKVGRLASVAGTSLLGRALSGVTGAF